MRFDKQELVLLREEQDCFILTSSQGVNSNYMTYSKTMVFNVHFMLLNIHVQARFVPILKAIDKSTTVVINMTLL